MARKRVPIFPIFEEVRRITAELSDEQFGRAIRYALNCYYGNEEPLETDDLTKFAAKMLLEQAARYDEFRDRQRRNASNDSRESEPSAANVSQVQPKDADCDQEQPSDPPSPSPGPIPSYICSKAVELLNELSGSSFRSTTQKTQKLIAAREREGYTLEDFETVIRHKCGQWVNDAKMQQYLRPETLFGGKFEAYLSDVKRHEPQKEQRYTLAPLEDPYEVATREAMVRNV